MDRSETKAEFKAEEMQRRALEKTVAELMAKVERLETEMAEIRRIATKAKSTAESGRASAVASSRARL